MTSKFSIEPRVAFVSQLLGEISDGTLQIPRFQRTFVWTWEQQRDLLCSVFEGLPIGAILVWSTSLNNIVSYEKIGPYTLDIRNSRGAAKHLYLMDGLQRMTTFYSTLYYPENAAVLDNNIEGDLASENKEVGDELNQDIVYVDLDAKNVTDMFLRKRDIQKAGMGTSESNFMPISFVFHTKKFVQFTRRIPADKEYWIDRADEVASAFKNYKIPIVPLESDDQSLVTKSFERINTRGTVMSEAHMLNALSYSASFDLLERIEYYSNELLAEHADNDEFDMDFVLAVVKLLLNLDIYYKDTDKLATLVNDELLKKAFEGIKRYYSFIKENFGMEKTSQVPYKLQSFAIAYAFAIKPQINESLIKQWFYVSTYAGAFGATARNSSTALTDFRKLVEDGALHWSLNIRAESKKWSENITLRSARMKAWVLALGLKQEEVLDNSILREYSKDKGRCLKLPIELRGESKKPGFYFLVSTQAKDFSLTKLSEEEMLAHFITPLMIKYLNEGELERFREERESLIYRYEVQELLKPAALELGFDRMEYGPRSDL
ncbi:protein of unknown function DUF262 [Glaciecola sp. 4H-3-7+YE-5]|nr:protein of unknown function DUF262 [Glaciecola sp. 4H-3-7+YE-5]